uniref:GH16 domain-containing protein n=1 Tax=Zooxanthella nutricula TaxID=1333877 RepID=A0A7S2KIT3_9DINO
MKYSHVPYGCGTWPAFFTLGRGPWPDAGEVDILEYVNNDVSKSSMHIGASCTLNAAAVDKKGSMPDRNNMNYNCRTSYPGHLGCAPNKWMKTGQGWSQDPGVVAMEWTPDFVKIFFIPQGAIPNDLSVDAPTPEDWDQWLFSYYPITESGCSAEVMQAQQLVMQIGFCGDWASKVWHLDATCKPLMKQCRSVDPLHEYAPQEDCCTQFIESPEQDEYLKERAYFNISWVKVFQKT